MILTIIYIVNYCPVSTFQVSHNITHRERYTKELTSLNARLPSVQPTSNLLLQLRQTNFRLILGELHVPRRLPLHQPPMIPLFGALVLLIVVLARQRRIITS